MDAFYVGVELHAPPRAAGQARRGRGLRPARGRHDRLLRGSPVRRVLRHPGRAGAPAVPGGDLPPARLRGVPHHVQARDGPRPRARSRRSRSPASTRPISTSPASSRRARRCAAWSPRSRRDTGLELLGRHRAEPAGGEGRLRRREARGLRRAHARAGVRALRRRRAAAACRGSGRRRPSGSRRSGSRRSAQLAATPPRALADALRRPPRPLPPRPRALRGRGAVTTSASRCRESRETTFPTRRRRRAEQAAACAGSPASCATGSPSASGAGARSRSSCASTTSRPSPAPAPSPRRRTTPRVVADVACALLREYAPPRPVRLLGVRVAGVRGTERHVEATPPADALRSRRRGLGPIAPGGTTRRRFTMAAMTDTRTASQHDHGRGHLVAGCRGRDRQPRRVRVHARPPPARPPARRPRRALRLPQPVWEELYAAGPDHAITRSSRTRRAGPRAAIETDEDVRDVIAMLRPQLRPRPRTHGLPEAVATS